MGFRGMFGVIPKGFGWFVNNSKRLRMPTVKPRRWSVGVLGAAAVLFAVCSPLAGSAAGRNATLRALTSAASCSQWNVSGTWKDTQREAAGVPPYHITFRFSQSGTSVTGQPIMTKAEAAASTYTGTTGTLSGTLIGNHLNVLVTWPPLASGRVVKGPEIGTVTATAIINGVTWDLANPSVKATWTATGHARCVRH